MISKTKDIIKEKTDVFVVQGERFKFVIIKNAILFPVQLAKIKSNTTTLGGICKSIE